MTLIYSISWTHKLIRVWAVCNSLCHWAGAWMWPCPLHVGVQSNAGTSATWFRGKATTVCWFPCTKQWRLWRSRVRKSIREQIYCLHVQSAKWQDNVECTRCLKWFHNERVGLKEIESDIRSLIWICGPDFSTLGYFTFNASDMNMFEILSSLLDWWQVHVRLNATIIIFQCVYSGL